MTYDRRFPLAISGIGLCFISHIAHLVGSTYRWIEYNRVSLEAK
jgi:hypothetical protein